MTILWSWFFTCTISVTIPKAKNLNAHPFSLHGPTPLDAPFLEFTLHLVHRMVLVLQVSLVAVTTVKPLAAHVAGKVEVALAQLAMAKHGLLVFERSATAPAPKRQNEGRCDQVTMTVTV